MTSGCWFKAVVATQYLAVARQPPNPCSSGAGGFGERLGQRLGRCACGVEHSGLGGQSGKSSALLLHGRRPFGNRTGGPVGA